MFSRRQAIMGLGGLALVTGLSGCAMPVTPVCANDPRLTDPSTPLTIDTHVHVFNGSDLQVARFIGLVIQNQLDQETRAALGDVLQKIAWSLAPSGDEELFELQRIRAALQACEGTQINQVVEGAQEEAYQRARRALGEAIERGPPSFRSRARLSVERRIQALPPTARDYRSQRRQRRSLRGRDMNIQGVLDFVIQNFQFRYVNTYDYLNAYSRGRSRKVDLIVSHLVDFDWPIAGGERTATPLTDQIRVMEEIAVLTGGRIHSFAPFDPFRDIAARRVRTRLVPFDLARDAVENRGFLGIKLYPAMGFAPFGNADLQIAHPNFWNQPWLSDEFREDPQLGRALDESLGTLYTWCRQNDVPIMAHTARSNGPSAAFETLSDPKYWRKALAAFPGLRVSFGHFGDPMKTPSRAAKFAGLMTPRPGTRGEFAFADSGYFSEALSRPEELRSALTELYRVTANKGNAALAQRLMYGSDWEMMLIEGPNVDQYLARFESIFAELDGDPTLGAAGRLSDQFFGRNAVTLFGLRQNEQTRTRLERFYARRGVPVPVWMRKVDGVTALAR